MGGLYQIPAQAVDLFLSLSPAMCKQLERPLRSGGPVNLGYDISQVTGAESQSQLDAVIEEYVPKVRGWYSLCTYVYKYIILSSCCECMWETGQCAFTVFS